MKTIYDLLTDNSELCWLQGSRTRLYMHKIGPKIRFIVYSSDNNITDPSYAKQVFGGESEEEAVKAFVRNERK